MFTAQSRAWTIQLVPWSSRSQPPFLFLRSGVISVPPGYHPGATPFLASSYPCPWFSMSHISQLSAGHLFFPRRKRTAFPACHAGADARSSGPEAGGLAWTVLADPWAVSTQVLVAMVGNAICAIRTDGSSILAYVDVYRGAAGDRAIRSQMEKSQGRQVLGDGSRQLSKQTNG